MLITLHTQRCRALFWFCDPHQIETIWLHEDIQPQLLRAAQVEKGAPVSATANASVSPQPGQHAMPGRSDLGARLLPIYGVNLIGLCAALRYHVSHALPLLT